MPSISIMDRIKKHLDNVEHYQERIEGIKKEVAEQGVEESAEEESSTDKIEKLKLMQDGYKLRVLDAGDKIRDFLESQGEDFWTGCKTMTVHGREVDQKSLAEINWTQEKMLLKVRSRP